MRLRPWRRNKPLSDFFTQLGLSALWLGSVILASVWYRRSKGKPLRPRPPDDALYYEDRISGPWNSRAAQVWLTSDQLVITPRFPFTLMFLPEIYGFEHAINIESISAAETYRSRFQGNARVFVDGTEKPIWMKLRRPNSFFETLEAAQKAQKIAIGNQT